jgi:hypothetical protein
MIEAVARTWAALKSFFSLLFKVFRNFQNMLPIFARKFYEEEDAFFIYKTRKN